MNQFENSSVKLIKKGSHFNWIFLPGGPGLGADCFNDFIKKCNGLQGSVYSFNYAYFKKSNDDSEYFARLIKDFLDILNNFENIILVGHSFGGMLLQVLPTDNTNVSKVILLNSSPDLKCFKLADQVYETFNISEKTL